MRLSEVITFMRETSQQQPTNSPDIVYLHCILCIERLVNIYEYHKAISSAGFSAFWALCDNYQFLSCSGKETAKWVNEQRKYPVTYLISLRGDDFKVEKA